MGMHKGLIGQSEGGASAQYRPTHGGRPDVTLNDYIKRKTENRGELGNWPFPTHLQIKPTKLTFNGWWEQNQMKAAFLHVDAREAEFIWHAAQENK